MNKLVLFGHLPRGLMNKSVLFGLVNTASVKTLGTSSLGVFTPANTSTMTHTTTEMNTANSLMTRLTWEYGQ